MRVIFRAWVANVVIVFAVKSGCSAAAAEHVRQRMWTSGWTSGAQHSSLMNKKRKRKKKEKTWKRKKIDPNPEFASDEEFDSLHGNGCHVRSRQRRKKKISISGRSRPCLSIALIVKAKRRSTPEIPTSSPTAVYDRSRNLEKTFQSKINQSINLSASLYTGTTRRATSRCGQSHSYIVEGECEVRRTSTTTLLFFDYMMRCVHYPYVIVNACPLF